MIATNLHRQFLFSFKDIGEPKVELAKRQLSTLNPFVTIITYQEMITSTNVEEIIRNYDVVLDCTDCIQTKFLLHDACRFHNIPLVQAGIYKFQGQLHVFRHGENVGCLRCLWQEVPEEHCIRNCNDVGIIGAIPGILGTLQVMETIKILLDLKGITDKEMVLVDLISLSISKIQRTKNPNCPMCGKRKTINCLNSHFSKENEWEVTPSQLSEKTQFTLIDIRNLEEIDPLSPLENSLKHISANNIESLKASINEKFLLICQKGIRSKKLVGQLRKAGYNHVFSLSGGIEQWKKWESR